MPKNRKGIAFDWDFIFSLTEDPQCYSFTEQEIAILMQLWPQIEWSTRWHGDGGLSPDEIKAFSSNLLTKLMTPQDC